MKTIIAIALSIFFSATVASAEQYQRADGRVVHTRLAPVVMHRVSPPFRGRHVYARGPAPNRVYR
jgi:hypothetical protein